MSEQWALEQSKQTQLNRAEDKPQLWHQAAGIPATGAGLCDKHQHTATRGNSSRIQPERSKFWHWLSRTLLLLWPNALDSLPWFFTKPRLWKAQQWKGWSWCWMTSMPPLPSTRQVNKFHKITLMPLAEHPCKESLLGLWSLLLRNEGLAQKLAGEFICSHLEAK